MQMNWDYFISYASEDKEYIVEPFAFYLKSAEFSIWYDDFSLKVGDSLLQAISRGLSESKFAIVFFSPSFFKKKWPQNELNGLFALEQAGRRCILPVWHGLTASDIAVYSPILADRKAADTRKGLQDVAEQIVSASFPERAKGLPLSSALHSEKPEVEKAQRAFRNLLTENPTTNDLFMLLSGYPALLRNIVGYDSEVIPGYKLPGRVRCDFAILTPHGISGPIDILLVLLGPEKYERKYCERVFDLLVSSIGERQDINQRSHFGDHECKCLGEYPNLKELGQGIQSLVSTDNACGDFPDYWRFQLLLFAGRRQVGKRSRHRVIRDKAGIALSIATYDRLLDSRENVYR